MLRSIWRDLRSISPQVSKRIAALGFLSAMTGFAEAAVLVLLVNAAIGLSAGRSGLDLGLPLLGSLSDSRAVTLTCLFALLVVIVNVATAKLMAKMSATVLDDARDRVFDSFVTASWSRKSDEREGTLMHEAGMVASQCSDVSIHLAQTVSSTLGLVMLLTAALLLDVTATVLVVGFGAMLLALTRPISRSAEASAEQLVQESPLLTTDISRLSDGSMELGLYGAEREFADEVVERSRSLTNVIERLRFNSKVATTLHKDAAIALLAIGLAVVHWSGFKSVAPVGAVLLIIIRSLAYSAVLQQSLQQLRELRPAVTDLLSYTASMCDSAEEFGGIKLQKATPIEVCGVGFSYAGREPVLTGVDLRIDDNEVLGIVGSSGGGKSTLLQVLLRLRQPDRGEVLVGGRPYQDYSVESWASAVALVPQEPQLMAMSVADNIRFFRSSLTTAQIERAADAANVGDEIRHLPNGFDTVLGPRGSGLSGGQKQRVAIARAIVGEPLLLVLDEPSSALDQDSEAQLVETISALRSSMTIVVVAHRLSTLAVCDRIVRVSGGSIMAVGDMTDVDEHDLE